MPVRGKLAIARGDCWERKPLTMLAPPPKFKAASVSS